MLFALTETDGGARIAPRLGGPHVIGRAGDSTPPTSPAAPDWRSPPRAEPADAAAWVEGLLRGSAKVLLYEDAVWAALDGWLTTLDDERFLEVLPLLRRSFAHFVPPNAARWVNG